MLDTEIWSQRWFCDLSTDAKMLYFYFWGNCNHAGILDLWEKRFKDDTGLSLAKCISEMEGLIIEYKPGSFLMPKFVNDQYPDFPNSKVRAQDSAIKLLDREGLTDFILNPLERVSKPLDKGYGYGYGNDNGIDNGIDNGNIINKGVEKIEKNLPAKRTKKTAIAWNENDPEGMLNLPGEAKVKLTENQFLQILAWQGKRPYPGNELVWLTDFEFDELINRAGDKNIALKAIEILHTYKQEKKGVRTYTDDFRNACGWPLERARQAAKSAGYDPSKERQKEKIRKDNLNLFNEA